MKIKFILFITVIFVLSCNKNDESKISDDDNIELIDRFGLDVKEPSGLAIDSEKGVLYTVSDNTNNLYKISKEGIVLQEYEINADDLEGVCIYNSDLLLANERTKQLLKYNTITNSVVVHNINYVNNAQNSGLEGVTYNSNKNLIYILNEKNPGELLTLNSDFLVIKKKTLDFAKDYSGLFYDSQQNLLWIVSDESSTINKCDINGNLITRYKINVNKCEGITIDVNSGIIYVVSDSNSEMYLYKIK